MNRKGPKDTKSIVFLSPFILDNLHPSYWTDFNVKVLEVIERFRKEDVVFKLHPKDRNIVEAFLPKERIVEGDAEELIRKFDKIYCFRPSTIGTDCEIMGKDYEVVD